VNAKSVTGAGPYPGNSTVENVVELVGQFDAGLTGGIEDAKLDAIGALGP
jgi:hypothetical protein